jgi:transcriptional regulator with PAS, ATPase and Fis domain
VGNGQQTYNVLPPVKGGKDSKLARIKKYAWVEDFPAGITVCDSAGIILELNKKAAESLRAEGGMKLIDTNLLDCHPGPARRKLERLMRKRETNVYTVTKGRTRKIILQTPWYQRGRYRGFVEVSLPFSGKIPNHIRKP